MPHATIYYQPDGYVTTGQKLMGRQAAGEGSAEESFAGQTGSGEGEIGWFQRWEDGEFGQAGSEEAGKEALKLIQVALRTGF